MGMRGSMRQRTTGSWELRVFVGRDPLSGRRQYVSKTFRGGKREAQRELAALAASAEATAPTADLTVGAVLERWLEHATPNLSPSTVATNRVVLDAHLLPHIGSTPLRKLTPHKVDALYRLLAERGGQNGKPLAPSTVQRAHNVLHRALEQAVRWGWLASNPASRATPPRRAAVDIAPPAPDDLVRVIALAEESNPDLALFLLVAAATGARRSELVALRWSDLDLEAGAVVIGRGRVFGANGVVVEKDTKTHAARRIALDSATVTALAAHRERARVAARACGVALPPRAFVFTDDVDGATGWRPDYVSKAFTRVARKAGLAGVRLHDLRHFVATRLLSNGVDVRTVAGRLGHKNPNVTLNVYAAFLPEADRSAAELLGKLLGSATDEDVDARTV
jgi:integrase